MARLGSKPREIGKAGWGWTAFSGVVSLIYFFPVLWIILTAFKTRSDALAVPPKFFFTPTLQNFQNVFFRESITAQAAQATEFPLYFVNRRSFFLRKVRERASPQANRPNGRRHLLTLFQKGCQHIFL